MASSNILVVTHNSPDGDALSCLSAFGEYLALSGKDYALYCHDRPPQIFSYLPRFNEIINPADHELQNFADYDTVVVCDCGSLSRTMLADEISGRSPGQLVIELDHHLKVEDYADIEIRDDRAAATAELVYEFLKITGMRFNKALSTAILTGIVTDTGSFLYPSTSDRTIRIASEMLVYGANLPKIVSQTMKNKSLGAMKAWGQVLSGLRINEDYGVAVSLMTKEDIRKAGVSDDELEGISGFLSNLKGARAILFLREKEDGLIRGSLRTSDSCLDISKLARMLGGGGHAKASGFSIEGSLKTDDSSWSIT